MAQISPSMLEYIRQEAERLQYGRIIIEVNASSDKSDIIVESRKRFPKDER